MTAKKTTEEKKKKPTIDTVHDLLQHMETTPHSTYRLELRRCHPGSHTRGDWVKTLSPTDLARANLYEWLQGEGCWGPQSLYVTVDGHAGVFTTLVLDVAKPTNAFTGHPQATHGAAPPAGLPPSNPFQQQIEGMKSLLTASKELFGSAHDVEALVEKERTIAQLKAEQHYIEKTGVTPKPWYAEHLSEGIGALTTLINARARMPPDAPVEQQAHPAANEDAEAVEEVSTRGDPRLDDLVTDVMRFLVRRKKAGCTPNEAVEDLVQHFGSDLSPLNEDVITGAVERHVPLQELGARHGGFLKAAGDKLTGSSGE